MESPECNSVCKNLCGAQVAPVAPAGNTPQVSPATAREPRAADGARGCARHKDSTELVDGADCAAGAPASAGALAGDATVVVSPFATR